MTFEGGQPSTKPRVPGQNNHVSKSKTLKVYHQNWHWQVKATRDIEQTIYCSWQIEDREDGAATLLTGRGQPR